MPPVVDRALFALLRAEGGERRGAGADAAGRRAVPEIPVLRRPPDAASPVPRGHADPLPGRSTDRLQAAYQAPRNSGAHPEHLVFHYLLWCLSIKRPNHVRCADFTYIRVLRGFLHLVAIMDWASRYVLA